MWGTAYVKQVCRAARQLGYTSLALTDTDNLYGLWPFLTACKREGLTPIIGAEVSRSTNAGSVPFAWWKMKSAIATSAGCSPNATWTTEFELEAALPAYATGLTVLTQCPGLLRIMACGGGGR